MKLKKSTILELGQILKVEFKLELSDQNLTRLAHILVGYFDLLIRVEDRHKFQNSPGVRIDQNTNIKLDEMEVK